MRNWNQYSQDSDSFGGMLPIWVEQPKRAESGGLLTSVNLVAGEVLSAGSPVEFNTLTHAAKILRVWKVKAVTPSAANSIIDVHNMGNLPALHAGDVVQVLGATMTTTATAVVVPAVDNTVANVTTFTVATAAIDAAVAAVKGKYTLTIGTVPGVADTMTVNSVVYTFAAAAAAGVIEIGSTKVDTAKNLQDVLEADNQNFVVKADGATLVFTQKVAGVGTIPTVAVAQVGGSIAASIATTLAGSVAVGGLIVGAYLVQSASATAGSGKLPYCVPNSLTIDDTIVGDQNSVGIAIGPKYVYENTIPYLPAIVAAGIPMLEYHKFAEMQNSGYVA